MNAIVKPKPANIYIPTTSAGHKEHAARLVRIMAKHNCTLRQAEVIAAQMMRKNTK